MSKYLAVAILLSSWSSPASAQKRQDLPALIAGLERSLARITDISADFVQIYHDGLNQSRRETGHLYLKRPRMMRWEYKGPEEQLFVSDGKTVYLYVPADRQVSRETVRESMDDRIPLMFLLGRSNLRSEFTRIEELGIRPMVEGLRVLRLTPRRPGEVSEVNLEVDPANLYIRKLVLVARDGARSEFQFSNIRLNGGLSSSLFDFKIPPGVTIVEGIGR